MRKVASLGVIAVLCGAAACQEAVDEPAGYLGRGATNGGAIDGGAASANGSAGAVCTIDVPTAVLAPSCGTAGCHAAQNAADALDLASPGVAQRVVGKSAVGGGILADPAHPADSVLYQRLLGKGGPRMPMSAPPLDDSKTACVLAWIQSLGGTAVDTTTTPPQSFDAGTGTTTTPTPSAARPTLRIAAGAPAPYTDPSGQTWTADTGFSGGRVVNNSPPLDVAQTTDDVLYSNERYGADSAGNVTDFSYSFAVPDGTYTVTLKFAETYSGAMGVGLRRFDVAIDGTKVLTDFDIYAAGGANTAVDKSFDVTAKGGTLRLDFQHGAVQAPKVNAIAIVPK